MSSTSKHTISSESLASHLTFPAAPSVKIKALKSSLLLPSRLIQHHPKSGINGIVDAASNLFTIMGKLRQAKNWRQPAKLQTELIQEINIFFETIKNQKYSAEYVVVCRYVICAALDDIIYNTSWGKRGQWEQYALLSAYNQDTQTHDKFFGIMERAIKEPAIYIDLMELMYLCLSMGYKGQYAGQHDQLEQITNHLYKHIRAWRGHFSKTLSLTASPTAKKTAGPRTSLSLVFFSTACIILTIFIALGYTMDIIANDAYQNLATMESSRSHQTAK